MGRTVIADEGVQSCIDSLYVGDKCSIGLIIGQTTPQRDYAVHLASCPDAEQAGGAKQGLSSLESVDKAWVATHARQVLRMLPGGLNVLGIFALASPDVMKAAQAKLRQVLFAVEATVQKEESCRDTEDDVSDRIILQICSVTHKLTCRTFDVADIKSTAKPADWKSVNMAEKFHCLQTQVYVDHVIPVTKAATSQSLEKQMLRGLQPVCDNIWNSLATVNGALLPREGALVESKSSSGKKGKKAESDTSEQAFTVQLYDHSTSCTSDETDAPELIDCAAKLCVRGLLCCRGFVHSRASVQEALQALKTDAIRSLVSRCELLCEDLLQAEEEQDPRVLYETPLRVFARLPGRSVLVSDYMFQDETPSDSTDRFNELLSVPLAEEDLELDCERVPEDAELDKPQKEVRERHSSGSPAPAQTKRTSNIVLLAAGVLVAGIAAAVSFLIQD